MMLEIERHGTLSGNLSFTQRQQGAASGQLGNPAAERSGSFTSLQQVRCNSCDLYAAYHPFMAPARRLDHSMHKPLHSVHEAGARPIYLPEASD